MTTPLTKCPSCGHEFTPGYELEEKQQSRTYQVTVNIEVEASHAQLADELVATILFQAQAKNRIGAFHYLPSKQLDHPSPIPSKDVTDSLRVFGGGIQAGLHT